MSIYELKSDDVFTKNGHTMFFQDVLKDLKRKEYLEKSHIEQQNELGLLRKQNEWISVKDGTPENDCYYLVSMTDGGVDKLHYCDDGYWCKHYGGRDMSKKVTHFKHLPESFKKKGDV